MDLISHRSVSEFFRQAVASAIRNQGVDTTELTEFYLVDLLSTFARMTLDDGEPLGIRLAQATLAAPEERAKTLRGIGDQSLYVSGFFAESLHRSLVDVDYYIRIGGSAYRQLARMPSRREQAEVYLELSGKFPRFVDVLAEVSEGGAVETAAGLVQLYERWLRTGSEWIARKLRARGVLPGGGEIQ